MIIFHSNIHHRGINFTSGNRRLLQIFDVCLNKYDYYENIPKLKIVKTYNCKTVKLITELIKKIFKNNKNETLIFVHYFLVYYDLQYKVGIMSDLSPYDKNVVPINVTISPFNFGNNLLFAKIVGSQSSRL